MAKVTFKEIMRQVNQFIVDSEDWSLSSTEVTVPLEALKELSQAADAGRVIEVPLSGDAETVEVPDLETAKMPEVK